MHIVRGCVGFEVLIDVLAHMFDQGVGFSLASCVHGGLFAVGNVKSQRLWAAVVSIVYVRFSSNGEEACYVDGGCYLE